MVLIMIFMMDFTYDGNSNQNGMKIYINGILSATGGTAAISNSILNNKLVALGAESDGSRVMFGQLDDMRIYNTELTASQIATLAGP